MNEPKRWLDRMVQRFCGWLNDYFPNQHGLAVAGNSLAGLGKAVILPVDRRVGPTAVHMAHGNWMAKANAASIKPNKAMMNVQSECSFWAYCYMSGQPCVWCGGSNSTLSSSTRDMSRLCPKGKSVGSAWYGCCMNPQGVAKLIAFADCCGSGFCKIRLPCSNYGEAKNWCTYVAGQVFEGGAERNVYGTLSYYCTVALDTERDDTCAS